MATHSSVLAWRIPEMGEPGELPSIGSHRVDQTRLKQLRSSIQTLKYSKLNLFLLDLYKRYYQLEVLSFFHIILFKYININH